MLQSSKWRDFAVSLSLANLWFLRLWPGIIRHDLSQDYYVKYPITISFVFLLFANILILASLFAIIKLIADRCNSSFCPTTYRLFFIMCLFVPANSVRMLYPDIINFNKILYGSTFHQVFSITICVALFVIIMRYQKTIFNLASLTVLLLFPFVIIAFAQASWAVINITNNNKAYLDKNSAPMLNVKNNHGKKILWLIFDELDQRITFENRPNTLKLPALDRLRNESFYSINALPPAGETLLSLPAYIIGKSVVKAEPSSPNEIMLTLLGSNNEVGWSTLPNIFTRAHELGANSALIGWTHPYSRVIGGSLQSCYWEPNTYNFNFTNSLKIMLKQIQFALEIPSVPILGRTIQTELHINSYRNILEATKKAITDQNINFVLAHFPVPHAPFIYDRNSSKFVLHHNRPPSAYLDNLKLVDITFDNIRSEMESRKLWDNTTIIVTSDHWWRKSNEYDGIIDHKIPFIVKLPGKANKAIYTKQFNTIVAHDMVLAILDDRIKSTASLIDFISCSITNNATLIYR